MVPVPFIDLSRLTQEIAIEVEADWAECLRGNEFIAGRRVVELEQVLARQLGAAHVVACSNGSDALTITLQVMGVRRGMKVAMPDLTFWATYEAVVQLGATPVLIDIDPDDLHLSFEELRRAHDRLRFEACVLVHLFGWTSTQLTEIRQLCQSRNILLVEDGAQAFGVRVKGESVFASAAAATLSFHPAKVIGGAMDGGAMLFRSGEHAALARSLRDHGRAERYSHNQVGFNARMAELQAAFLLRVVARAGSILESRRAATRTYHGLLAATSGIRLFRPPAGVEGNGYLYVIGEDSGNADATAARLSASGIGVRRTYPAGLSGQSPAHRAVRHGALSKTHHFCQRVLNLPLFYRITPQECEQVAQEFLSIVDAQR